MHSFHSNKTPSVSPSSAADDLFCFESDPSGRKSQHLSQPRRFSRLIAPWQIWLDGERNDHSAQQGIELEELAVQIINCHCVRVKTWAIGKRNSGCITNSSDQKSLDEGRHVCALWISHYEIQSSAPDSFVNEENFWLTSTWQMLCVIPNAVNVFLIAACYTSVYWNFKVSGEFL